MRESPKLSTIMKYDKPFTPIEGDPKFRRRLYNKVVNKEPKGHKPVILKRNNLIQYILYLIVILFMAFIAFKLTGGVEGRVEISKPVLALETRGEFITVPSKDPLPMRIQDILPPKVEEVVQTTTPTLEPVVCPNTQWIWADDGLCHDKPIQQPVAMPVTTYTSGVEQWRTLVARYDWNVNTVLAIMRCESGGNPNAVGDRSTAYSSYGLLQVRALPGRPEPTWLLVPENNISYSYSLYKANGYTPWTCYSKI